jgi:hypothetical protein
MDQSGACLERRRPIALLKKRKWYIFTFKKRKNTARQGEVPMKLTNGKTSQLLAMALTFVFILGFCLSGPAAGQARLVKKQENTRQTAGDSNGTASPAPVVDDSPINPDTAGKKKTVDASQRQKNSNQEAQKTSKKGNPHRLW